MQRYDHNVTQMYTEERDAGSSNATRNHEVTREVLAFEKEKERKSFIVTPMKSEAHGYQNCPLIYSSFFFSGPPVCYTQYEN